MRTRVWVDDPHAVLRRGMVATLSVEGLTAERFAVVGESKDLRPVPAADVADVIIFASDTAALRAVRRLPMARTARLVATVADADDAHLHALAEFGVAAILLREELTPEQLVATMNAVAAGRTDLPQRVLPRLLAHAARMSAVTATSLTPREREVLRLLADGQDTRCIAEDLCYSERTVKNVVHDVLTKLNCRTRAQAVGLATRAGVI